MLEGIRVLDLTRLVPGPYCTLMLADYGAEVIKIEDTGAGDYIRDIPPFIGSMGARYVALNRNKKSLSINLKSEKGKEIFLKLVESSDVVLESFRPGVMEKLGLGYETLKKYNESIILCRLSGYGQDGPYSQKPGHDINYISYAGLLGLNGRKGEKPSVPPLQIADLAAGSLISTTAILMAIIHRMKTGEGQEIDVSMMDGTIALMYTLYPNLFAGKPPRKGEERLTGGLACYNIYETKDGKYIAVGALEKKFWDNFCDCLGLEDWKEKLNAPPEVQEQMAKELQDLFLTKTRDEWMEVLEQKDTCCSPILDLEEVMEDPHVKARNIFQTFTHEQWGDVTQIRPAFVSSIIKEMPPEWAPERGRDSRGILEELGFEKGEIDQLIEQQIIAVEKNN